MHAPHGDAIGHGMRGRARAQAVDLVDHHLHVGRRRAAVRIGVERQHLHRDRRTVFGEGLVDVQALDVVFRA